MIKLLDFPSILQCVAKANAKWCMYVSVSHDVISEIYKAAPYLRNGAPDYQLDHPLDGYQIILDGSGILVFDSEEECYECYNQTVGDDGPTKLNPYNGPARVYALTCDPKGKLRSENT